MLHPARAIGVDLAWGQRGSTGLAAITPEGNLVAMDTAGTDDEIEQWLATHAPGPCVVAFDAPLIVRNTTGMRDCERLVGRRFGARGASCYPSNMSNPRFADGGRAFRLSGHLGLDTGLTNVGPRRAIEVYPHAALVSLFDLPTVLRYKRGRQRLVADRREEMLRLLTLVETLRTEDPPLFVEANHSWSSARRSIEGATRPLHLNAVEDAVDAVVCAYVALLAMRSPARVEVFGTEVDGAIVVPAAITET